MSNTSSTCADTLALATAVAPSAADQQSLWQYLLDHIDEFPVAKVIVEHFDANGAHLARTEIAESDMIAIHLRAKITIKRQQIAWAETQAALGRAREASKGLRGALSRVRSWRDGLCGTLCSDSGKLAILMAAMSAVYWMR